jgi:hypothetical protein
MIYSAFERFKNPDAGIKNVLYSLFFSGREKLTLLRLFILSFKFTGSISGMDVRYFWELFG